MTGRNMIGGLWLGCLLLPGAVLMSETDASAQKIAVNYDESKVGELRLPDPLVLQNGERASDAKTWVEKRRPEILRLFETEMHGKSPARPSKTTFEVFDRDDHALEGKAIREQVTIDLTGRPKGPKADVLIYLPASASKTPAPVFLALSFTGNHEVSADRAIRLGNVWDRATRERRLADEASRGRSTQWALAKMLDRGYGLAVLNYQDIEPDFPGGIEFGPRPFFFEAGQTAPRDDDWGAIAAWAWGLSRVLDYLETDRLVDSKRVAVMGHSRLGKTALWAGARDERFALTISNDSGEGGAAIARRNYGETIEHVNTSFPHWFCANYKKYSRRADQLPFDSHMLIALCAPRPVYVASAVEDRWADPKGEFLGALNAGPVYRLFDKRGLDVSEPPPVDTPIMRHVGYHVRSGKHDVTAFDWEQYLSFADMHLKPGR